MFSNIIIFISALLISVLFPETKSGEISSIDSITGLIISYLVFFLVTVQGFKKLNQKEDEAETASALNKYLILFSVFALIIFSLNVYIFELPLLFKDIFVFKTIPTLLILLLLAVFTGFMWILWSVSHGYFNNINAIEVSKKEYIETQTGFALPSIIPWFAVSLAFDIIALLPFPGIDNFLNSILGQVIFAFSLLIMINCFIPVILKKFWKCDDNVDEETIEIIKNLSIKTGIKYKQALNWHLFGGGMITAGVIGILKNFRYILVTPGFSKYLSYEEKEAVIAHEFGHVKKLHLILYLALFICFILVFSFITDPIIFSAVVIFPKVLLAIDMIGEKISSLLLVFFVVSCFVIYLRFIFGYFMRNFERQADAYSFKVSGSSYPLISTFRKISAMTSEPPDKPNWHHYSIKERVDFLLECEDQPSKVETHDKKVKKELFIYFFITAILIFAGAKIGSYTINSKNLSKYEKFIEAQIPKSPTNYILYQELGNIKLEKKDEKGAVESYIKALSLNNESIETLNNLAWTYITSENPEVFNPYKGVKLAEKAVLLSKNPPSYIIDTLAEGYFRIGEQKEACSLAENAMEKAKDRKKYFKDQVKKICSK